MKFHELTESIAKEEGLKEQVNIAQIKEITSITLKKLAKMDIRELELLLADYKEET